MMEVHISRKKMPTWLEIANLRNETREESVGRNVEGDAQAHVAGTLHVEALSVSEDNATIIHCSNNNKSNNHSILNQLCFKPGT